MSDEAFQIAGESRFFTAPDGVRLHARVYGAASAATPALCLPGLARTALDFDALARALSEGRGGPPRRVVAIDYRGRGESESDPNGVYEVAAEHADLLAVAAALEITQAVVVGTSRGGLHAMILAASKPDLLRGVVLNDVGPRLETQGLLRIRAYVGKLPRPQGYAQAAAMLKEVAGAQFPALGDEDWRFFAFSTFKPGPQGLEPRYDMRLSRALEALDLTQPLPEMWPQFEGLAHAPVLALRGARSDLFSEATLDEMAGRHPRLERFTVPGQGHAPLLRDNSTIALICDAVARWTANA
jgi:pimeloyl-ACP methyl ester carboxylesterase